MAMQHSADQAAATPAAPGQEPGAAGAHAGAAEAGGHSAGLPQFDVAQWPGQILWFLIIFFGLMIFFRSFVVPRLAGTIETREGTISGSIADARRMKDEADAAAAAPQAAWAPARANAQTGAVQPRAEDQAAFAARLAEEEAKLAEKGAEAEARIAAARDAAMVNVQTIAKDAAGAIVQKLTGKAATAAELASARG